MPETLVPEQYRHRFVDAMAGFLATGEAAVTRAAGSGSGRCAPTAPSGRST